MADINYNGNDKQLSEIAQLIDNDFFLESIKEQIFNGLDCSNTDYLSKYYIKVEQIREKYQEEDYGGMIGFTQELLTKIIQWVEEKYGIELSYEEDNLEKSAKQIYQIFVTDLKNIISSGITSYIVENSKTIIDSIGIDNLKTSFLILGVEEELKYQLIAAGNIGALIDSIADMDIGFDEFITYAARGGDIECIQNIGNDDDDGVLSLSNGTEIFNTLMKSIRDSEYDHSIILTIHENILAQFNINKKEVSMYGENFNIQYSNPSEE